MIIRCAWHKKYFGFILYPGTKPPLADEGITDGMCPQCEAIEFLGIEVHRMERETHRLKEVIDNGQI